MKSMLESCNQATLIIKKGNHRPVRGNRARPNKGMPNQASESRGHERRRGQTDREGKERVPGASSRREGEGASAGGAREDEAKRRAAPTKRGTLMKRLCKALEVY